MKEVKDYNPSKDPRLIDCKTECGNGKCYAKRYGLFSEKTCPNFVEPKPVTNGDRLRAMTDEELASYLDDVWYGFEELPGMCDVCESHTVQKCSECWLDWLQQGAE